MSRYGIPLAAMICLWAASASQGQTSQSKPSNIDIALHWAKGDVFHFEVIKGLSLTEKGGGRNRMQIDLQVFDASKDGCVVSWTTRSSDFVGPYGKAAEVKDPVTAATMATFNNVPIEIKLSKDLKPVALLNFDKVKAAIQKTLSVVNESPSQKEAQTASIRDLFAKMAASQGLTLDVLSQDLCVVLQMSRTSVPAEGELVTETPIAPRLGGDTVATKLQLELVAFDKAGNTVTINGTQTLDPQSYAKYLEKLAKTAAAAGSKPPPAQTPEVTYEYHYVMDLKTGLPMSANYTRKIVLNNNTRQVEVEIYEITRK